MDRNVVENSILSIEKASSTLTIVADACGNGAYTGTERVEEAINLLVETITNATKQLRSEIWPKPLGEGASNVA